MACSDNAIKTIRQHAKKHNLNILNKNKEEKTKAANTWIMSPTYLESPPNELNKFPPIDGNPGKEFVKKEPLFSPKIIKT